MYRKANISHGPFLQQQETLKQIYYYCVFVCGRLRSAMNLGHRSCNFEALQFCSKLNKTLMPTLPWPAPLLLQSGIFCTK